MTEKQFENKVKAFLKDQGCWFLKTWSNGVQREGIPDLLICCNGYFLAVELKAPRGTVKPLQKHEIRKIRDAEGLAFPLYPDQFEAFTRIIKWLKTDRCDLALTLQYQFKGMGRKNE